MPSNAQRLTMNKFKLPSFTARYLLLLGFFGAAATAATSAAAQANMSNAPVEQSQLSSVLNINNNSNVDRTKIGYAREQTLKEMAIALGARAGLSDRSKELMAMIESRSAKLDAQFNFNPMVIGASVLPPVISESEDVVALEATAMRVAKQVYHIDEPARFAMPTPTWRNWLYIGLDSGVVVVPTLNGSGPNNTAEKQLWEKVTREGYEQGRLQAQAVYDANLAQLERTHNGMRMYFGLWSRGMVSAPIIASSSEILEREGPNTINVGNTLFRITAPTDFKAFDKWTPLE